MINGRLVIYSRLRALLDLVGYCVPSNGEENDLISAPCTPLTFFKCYVLKFVFGDHLYSFYFLVKIAINNSKITENVEEIAADEIEGVGLPRCYSSPDADPSAGVWRQAAGGIKDSPVDMINWEHSKQQYGFLHRSAKSTRPFFLMRKSNQN